MANEWKMPDFASLGLDASEEELAKQYVDFQVDGKRVSICRAATDRWRYLVSGEAVPMETGDLTWDGSVWHVGSVAVPTELVDRVRDLLK